MYIVVVGTSVVTSSFLAPLAHFACEYWYALIECHIIQCGICVKLLSQYLNLLVFERLRLHNLLKCLRWVMLVSANGHGYQYF